jgi:hypothetical protein
MRFCQYQGTDLFFVGFTFIDDMDLLQSQIHEEWQDVIRTLQDTLDTWEKGLKPTCGAIVPEKSAHSIIHFCRAQYPLRSRVGTF